MKKKRMISAIMITAAAIVIAMATARIARLMITSNITVLRGLAMSPIASLATTNPSTRVRYDDEFINDECGDDDSSDAKSGDDDSGNKKYDDEDNDNNKEDNDVSEDKDNDDSDEGDDGNDNDDSYIDASYDDSSSDGNY